MKQDGRSLRAVFISNSKGESREDALMTPGYWKKHSWLSDSWLSEKGPPWKHQVFMKAEVGASIKSVQES